MLTIQPIQSKDEQEDICRRCGALYLPASFAYSATVDGILTGVCQFSLRSGDAVLTTLQCAPNLADDEALLIMAHAAISFAERCGAQVVVCDAAVVSPSLLTRLGLKPQESGIYAASMTELFACRRHHT